MFGIVLLVTMTGIACGVVGTIVAAVVR